MTEFVSPLKGKALVEAKRRALEAVLPLTLFDVIELVIEKAARLSEGASMRVKSECAPVGVRVEVRVVKQRKPRKPKGTSS